MQKLKFYKMGLPKNHIVCEQYTTNNGSSFIISYIDKIRDKYYLWKVNEDKIIKIATNKLPYKLEEKAEQE